MLLSHRLETFLLTFVIELSLCTVMNCTINVLSHITSAY